MKSLEFTYKLWISIDGKPVIGPGGAKILKAIDRLGSISKASRELGMSYRFIWGYIRRVEEEFGFKIVSSVRGGESGGGTRLTSMGKIVLEALEDANTRFYKLSRNLTEYLNAKLRVSNE